MEQKKRRIKIGLALGKGTAKGFAHIGVLKELEKKGIKPDMIAGCSAGAIVGALYASGMSPKSMEKELLNVNWKHMFDFGVPKNGLIKGDALWKYIELLTQNKDFRELDIPLYVVSTNLTKKEKVIFEDGNVAKAVRASLAIPGIFDPIYINGDEYVDGGLTDPVPIDILKSHGADMIIAVDLSTEIKDIIANPPIVVSHGFFDRMSKELFKVEFNLFKEFVRTKELAKGFIPKLLRRIARKALNFMMDKFIKPAMAARYLMKAKVPNIFNVLYSSINVMENEFTRVKLVDSDADVIISPVFRNADWTDMDKARYFIARGASITRNKIKEIKKIIAAKSRYLP